MYSDDKESESEYEEETSYIILDLGTEATLDMLTDNNKIIKNFNSNKYHFSQCDGENEKVKDDVTYSLIGLKTDNPRMRIDISNPRQQYLTYTCQTTKKLILSRISLHPVESQNNLEEGDKLDDSFSLNDMNCWEDLK
ncbi:17647_t:CDS:2 [Cetraspora pellucida]|uniref:17647_t:CDS:1 n=1 Tax=Cetraspora pellucida TaxID=1433469 RepID=A0A9N9D527_9GLOM|nr:17647_t:CDS:2 [Cetraspora pellucida]